MLRHVALRDGFEIDLRHLKFLDSMGIATFGRFLTEMHQIGKKVTIIGNKANAWQDKSLSSFARLYNNLTVNLK